MQGNVVIAVNLIINGTCAPFTKARRTKPQVHLAKTARRRTSHDDPVNSNKNSHPKQNVLLGRPTVMINVGGKTVVCFVDTESAISLIKNVPEHVEFCLTIAESQVTRRCNGCSSEYDRRTRYTISLSLKIVHRFTITSLCPFPGDVLLGIDFFSF